MSSCFISSIIVVLLLGATIEAKSGFRHESRSSLFLEDIEAGSVPQIESDPDMHPSSSKRRDAANPLATRKFPRIGSQYSEADSTTDRRVIQQGSAEYDLGQFLVNGGSNCGTYNGPQYLAEQVTFYNLWSFGVCIQTAHNTSYANIFDPSSVRTMANSLEVIDVNGYYTEAFWQANGDCSGSPDGSMKMQNSNILGIFDVMIWKGDFDGLNSCNPYGGQTAYKYNQFYATSMEPSYWFPHDFIVSK